MTETVKEIDGKRVFIFDNVLALEELKTLETSLLLAKYNLLHVKVDSTSESLTQKDYRLLQAEIHPNDFVNTVIGNKINNCIDKYSGLKDVKLERVFSLCSKFGDSDYCHRDYFENSKGISAVYFASANWNNEWAGETIFFNKNEESEVIVSYRPNRLLIFDGCILHRAGLPSRLCKTVRLSLNARYGYKSKS